jgi:hypothetical protein
LTPTAPGWSKDQVRRDKSRRDGTGSEKGTDFTMRDNHRDHNLSRPPSRPRRSRRSRQPAPRRRTVRFALTETEFTDLEAAAARAGVARGAFAAEAALAVARGTIATAPGDPARDALAELIRAAGLVRRIGVNLNQAVAKLNATGKRCGDLVPYAADSIRRAERLDVIAEQVRNAIR